MGTGQTNNSEYTSNKFFTNKFSVILGNSCWCMRERSFFWFVWFKSLFHCLRNRVKRHDWQLSPAHDCAVRCTGTNSVLPQHVEFKKHLYVVRFSLVSIYNIMAMNAGGSTIAGGSIPAYLFVVSYACSDEGWIGQNLRITEKKLHHVLDLNVEKLLLAFRILII